MEMLISAAKAWATGRGVGVVFETQGGEGEIFAGAGGDRPQAGCGQKPMALGRTEGGKLREDTGTPPRMACGRRTRPWG